MKEILELKEKTIEVLEQRLDTKDLMIELLETRIKALENDASRLNNIILKTC